MKPLCFVPIVCLCRLSLAWHTTLHNHEQQMIQNNALHHTNPSPEFGPTFESPEHAAIGDAITLRYANVNRSGANLDYAVSGRKLTFGDIVALAGDFYADYRIGPCVESISDNWSSDQKRSLTVAAKNVDLLRRNQGGFLDKVMSVMYEQRDTISQQVRDGRDVAQAYKSTDDSFNFKYLLCTEAYAVIAFCNPDHFGIDAEKAYSSVHTLALQQAAKAHTSQSSEDLKEAYFIEAFSQHFLTDMFAAGHIRTPRRILHSAQFDVDLKVMPGDQCTKAQHDEDNANGLWVTNKEGQSWAAYGDKQFGQGRSAKNRQLVTQASQASVDEVWNVFETGNVIDPAQFAALKKTPLGSKTLDITNSVPLFEQMQDDKDYFYFRRTVDQRGQNIQRPKYQVKQDNSDWKVILREIESSGSFVNRLVYTKSFLADQKIVHLGLIDAQKSVVVTNTYGNVDAGSFGESWSMKSQGLTQMPSTDRKRRWSDFTSIGDGKFSLIGRQSRSGSTDAIHIGIKTTESPDGQTKSEVIWSENVDDGNGALDVGEVIYGKFDRSSDSTVMVKFFSGGSSTSKIELWTLAKGLDKAPTKQSAVNTPILNFLIPHKIAKADEYSTVVGYAGGRLADSTGTWFFCSWNNSYENPVVSTVVENKGTRPQAMLANPETGEIIRIYYGEKFSESLKMRIDVTTPIRDETNGSISIATTKSQRLNISWQRFLEQDYLLWFLHDVNGDGIQDLVAYTADASNVLLLVLAFPGKSDGSFADPVVSPIQLQNDKDSLLSGIFMTPIYTAQTTYTFPGSGSATKGAIISFFDNYGILGARLVGPESSKGSFKYELKGQNGAIAGQRSGTIGERAEKWMGSSKKPQPLGFAMV